MQAPWDEKTVKKLNEYQKSGMFHPYTCGNSDHEWYDRDLVATREGWICPKEGCNYTQTWAHEGSTTIVDVAAESFARLDSAGRGIGQIEGSIPESVGRPVDSVPDVSVSEED